MLLEGRLQMSLETAGTEADIVVAVQSQLPRELQDLPHPITAEFAASVDPVCRRADVDVTDILGAESTLLWLVNTPPTQERGEERDVDGLLAVIDLDQLELTRVEILAGVAAHSLVCEAVHPTRLDEPSVQLTGHAASFAVEGEIPHSGSEGRQTVVSIRGSVPLYSTRN